MQWAKKYSQYKNLEDDNLIEALYDFAFDLGISQFIFEVGELQAAEQKLGKKQEDWEDAEINAAMEMSPISNGLIDDLHRILPGNAELEQKLDSIRGQLEKAGLKEDKYQLEGLTFEDIKPYVSMYKGDDGKAVYDVLNKDGESDKKFADSKAAMAYLSQNYNRLKEATVDEADVQEEAEEINTELDRIKHLANIQ